MADQTVLQSAAHLEKLGSEAAGFPKLPGVYLMKDSEQAVIYVGKAKDLRNRVRSYFAGGDGRAQIEFLLRRIRSIEKIVTETEAQAFVLERDLITKYKPRYNIRLKDDKAYLSVRIDRNALWPRLDLVRKVQDDGATYFGPYSFSYELRAILEIIRKVIPLRTCTDTVFFNRQRPCLEYQIKRCAGPCCLAVDKGQYNEWVKQAMAVLEGKTAGLQKMLQSDMERASTELRFEDAAELRDRLEILKNVQSGSKLVSSDMESRDVYGFYREEGLAAVSVLFARSGRISGSANFTFSDVSVSDGEVLESVLSQFYQGSREIPAEIVLPFDFENSSLIQETLSTAAGAKIELCVPQRGSRYRLLGLAQLNAKQHFLGSYNPAQRYMEVAAALAQRFKLRQVPRKIECADISNLQGSDIVGAVVAFVDGAPDKKFYRHYKISFQDKPDDFAAMFEVITRRLRRGQEENDLPDLLIIDGGPGQLAKALEARDKLGLFVEIVSIAKMRTESGALAKEISRIPERIYIENVVDPLILEEGHEMTRFFQRVRDEAHRFVITFHRRRRSERVFKSALDDIAGVRPEMRRRLLKHFGSVERIKGVPENEVAKVGRMPGSLARKILAALGG